MQLLHRIRCGHVKHPHVSAAEAIYSRLPAGVNIKATYIVVRHVAVLISDAYRMHKTHVRFPRFGQEGNDVVSFFECGTRNRERCSPSRLASEGNQSDLRAVQQYSDLMYLLRHALQ